jgi:hypothetical protein
MGSGDAAAEPVAGGDGDDGTVYFTGYLAVSPLPEYAGLGMTGPVYRLALEAVSDEILLDTQLIAAERGNDGRDGGADSCRGW